MTPTLHGLKPRCRAVPTVRARPRPLASHSPTLHCLHLRRRSTFLPSAPRPRPTTPTTMHRLKLRCRSTPLLSSLLRAPASRAPALHRLDLRCCAALTPRASHPLPTHTAALHRLELRCCTCHLLRACARPSPRRPTAMQCLHLPRRTRPLLRVILLLRLLLCLHRHHSFLHMIERIQHIRSHRLRSFHVVVPAQSILIAHTGPLRTPLCR